MAKQRYFALDFFRGLTIAMMIVVNNPGNWSHVFPPLLHAKWHGCTPTDLVFPFFLFIVGVSARFSLSPNHPNLTRKILKRTALIFLIGLLLNAFPFYNKDYNALRIMGVLQRIALAYGAGALLLIYLPKRWLYLTSGALLALYWMAIWLLGGADPYSLEHNFARIVDRFLLTDAHLYKGFGMPFDPEGLFSTIPATVTVILGYLMGDLIHQYKENTGKLCQKLIIHGAIFTAIGYAWSFAFPLNKPLWSSSYVLFTAGLAAIFLSACIWVLDIQKWRAAARPFLVFGANPLIAFVLSGLIVKTLMQFKYEDQTGQSRNALYWIYNTIFYPIEPYKTGSLLYALVFTGVVWIICWVLYRKKIFLKV